MGLTFLLLGIGFANPFPLVLRYPQGMWEHTISMEALNLYSLTVFLGWGHFFYAWQGQWRGTAKLPTRRRASYWAAMALTLGVLVAARGQMGVGLFSLVVWIYNIAHFIKAEQVFRGQDRRETARGPAGFLKPAIAFAWFTLVLFHLGPLDQTRLVFAGTVAIAGVMLLAGDWRLLLEGEVGWPLLTLFLLGETLVWSAYRPTPAFAVGVYLVHVAAASFFHYLGSYFFAQRGTRTPPLLRPGVIVGVNVLTLFLGCEVDRFWFLWPLRYVLAPEWFTLWLALHLVGSDLLPVWKRTPSRSPGGETLQPTAVSLEAASH